MESQLKSYQQLFDVVMIDPPWQICMKVPYGVLTNDDIVDLPF